LSWIKRITNINFGISLKLKICGYGYKKKVKRDLWGKRAVINNKCIYTTSLSKNDKKVRMSLISSIISFLQFDNNDVITKRVIIASFLCRGNNEAYPDKSSHYYVIVVFGGIGETCAYSWLCNFYSAYKPSIE
ncbi:hypothetical protein KA005_47155, partial [bacterium]|nr:hypothetical protein [bacterium]